MTKFTHKLSKLVLGSAMSVISTANNSVVAILPVGNFAQSVAFETFEPEIDPIGALTQDQGAGLIDKIQEASAKLDAGQTGAACNQLSSFINQVNAFISNGTLTPAQGQLLIDAANALKTNLGC